jgi:CheY-like chemotaxis protein
LIQVKLSVIMQNPKFLNEECAVVPMPFRYRILLVDDEPGLRQLGQSVLESQGYEVLCAGDGFEGLAALKQSLPDVVISDLNMPNMSGFEFLSVVRQRFPQIPVIVISGEFSGTDVPDSVLADAFFEKGHYAPVQLFEKIIELFQEIPARPRSGKAMKAPVWVHGRLMAVTCTRCLRTFPIAPPAKSGPNEADCDFCSTRVKFQIHGMAFAASGAA